VKSVNKKNDHQLNINKGVELMLRPKNKKGDDLTTFQINFEKMISLFKREFHFNIRFNIRKK
jgi:hypothetical protein